VSLQTKFFVCVSCRQLLKSVGKLAALHHSAPAIGRHPKAKDRHKQLARVTSVLRKLTGTAICSRRLGRNKPLGRQQRQTPGQLQFDLAAVAIRPFGQCGQDRQAAVEMADCFEIGQALGSMSAGLEPLIDRPLGVSGGGQMMCQKLGLALDGIGEMLLQRRCDAGVQFLSSCPQQSAVGGILHQRVLKEIRWIAVQRRGRKAARPR